MKKIFTLLLAVAASVGTMFASDIQVDGIWYDFDSSSKTASVTFRGAYSYSYSNEYTNSVVIPASVTYNSVSYSVTSIRGYAFSGCTGLTSVTIPNSVTSIGDGAFSGCTGLSSVTIPNSVTSIGMSAFLSCTGLSSVTIPNSVTSIGDDAFTSCTGLSSVTIPNSVTSIGNSAFSSCTGLTSVTIESDAIVSKAYIYDTNLKNIFGDQVKEYIIGNSVTSIGDYAFYNCTGLTSVTIGNSVTSIGKRAFRWCSGLTSVTIPNSVTSIGDYAFYDCTGLTSLIIGNSVTSIGDEAFSGCTHVKILVWEMAGEVPSEICSQMTELTDITIGEDVTSIEKGTFDNCMAISSIVWNARNCPTIEDENTIFPPFDNSIENITSFTFGEEVEIIPVGICSGMENLTSMTIPNSVTSIGDGAFSSCTGLTSVTIGNSVTSIGDWAFYECSSLTSATIGNSVTSIGDGAFDWCSGLTSVNITDIAAWCNITFSGIDSNPLYYAEHLYVNNVEVTNLVIPNSVTSIGDYAFSCCSSLTSVTIPNSVTSIGEGAFYRCTGLTSVTIPNSVTSIGEEAFRNCTRLSSVTIEADIPPTLGHYVFDGEEYFPLTYPIYVPCNAVNAYKTAWSDYADRIVANCSSFTISFVNWDGSNLQTLSVAEGEMPQYTGSTPTRPDDEEYTYTFLGWTPAIVAVTEDATYTATYTATPKGQGIEEVPSDQVPSTKVLRNGILFIERGEKVYTLQGQEAQ